MWVVSGGGGGRGGGRGGGGGGGGKGPPVGLRLVEQGRGGPHAATQRVETASYLSTSGALRWEHSQEK